MPRDSAPEAMEAALCTLQDSVGRVEECPGAGCPFWFGDRAAAGCMLAPVVHELRASPEVALHLLELRGRLRDEEQAAGG